MMASGAWSSWLTVVAASRRSALSPRAHSRSESGPPTPSVSRRPLRWFILYPRISVVPGRRSDGLNPWYLCALCDDGQLTKFLVSDWGRIFPKLTKRTSLVGGAVVTRRWRAWTSYGWAVQGARVHRIRVARSGGLLPTPEGGSPARAATMGHESHHARLRIYDLHPGA